MFKNVDFSERVIDVHPQHNCSSKESISLCCIDGHGKLFTVAFWLIDFQFSLMIILSLNAVSEPRQTTCYI